MSEFKENVKSIIFGTTTIYGKLFGTLISVFGFTIGCSLLYLFANSFFKELLQKKLAPKIYKFKELFN